VKSIAELLSDPDATLADRARIQAEIDALDARSLALDDAEKALDFQREEVRAQALTLEEMARVGGGETAQQIERLGAERDALAVRVGDLIAELERVREKAEANAREKDDVVAAIDAQRIEAQKELEAQKERVKTLTRDNQRLAAALVAHGQNMAAQGAETPSVQPKGTHAWPLYFAITAIVVAVSTLYVVTSERQSVAPSRVETAAPNPELAARAAYEVEQPASTWVEAEEVLPQPEPRPVAKKVDPPRAKPQRAPAEDKKKKKLGTADDLFDSQFKSKRR
jgi:hypothetical protein